MDERALQALVERISLEVFHKPFQHRALFNDRLKTTGGRYLLSTHNIELNRKYYEQYGEEELVQVIRHELCHYHLHLEGKGYRHRDRDFRELMRKVQAPRFCKSLVLPKEKKTYYYECTACRYVYVRKKEMNTARYVWRFCRGKLKKVKKDS